MTRINQRALEAAADAFGAEELRGGVISLGDQLSAAIEAYQQAEADGDDYRHSTAVLGVGEKQMEAVQELVEQHVTGNGHLREKTRKFFDGVLCEMLDGFEAHFANDTRWNLQTLIIKKAELLVDALLQGDEAVMKSFLGWSRQNKNRQAVLEAIGDYAAKAEVEGLRKEVDLLRERDRYRGSY